MRKNREPTATVMGLVDWDPGEHYRFFVSWNHQLKRPNSKPHSNATSVLTHIVYYLTDKYTVFDELYTTIFDPYLIWASETMHISQRQVQSGILFLDEKRILLKQPGVSPGEAFQILRDKTPQTLDRGFGLCPWCGCRTMKLQAHHYPVAAKDGGTETVTICANCHYEYHALIDGYGYTLNQDEFERITYEVDRGEG